MATQELEIRTNNQFRPILNWFELTEKEQSDLQDNYDTIQESSFFRYKGQICDLSDFMRNDNFNGWDAYSSDTYFSGLLIKLSDCGDMVKVGMYYS